MGGCGSYIVPTQTDDLCGGDKKSTKCVVDANAFIELNLPVNSTQEQINQALYQVLLVQKTKIDAMQAQIDAL
jgi:hypothetical protein